MAEQVAGGPGPDGLDDTADGLDDTADGLDDTADGLDDTADGLDDTARVVARDEIRQLAYRYAWAVDTRDLDLLVSLFVPDVRVGRDASGPDALRAFWADSLRAIGVSILFVGNHVVDFDDPDHARGLVYCRGCVEPRDGPHPGRLVEQAILYRDTYERRDGRWLFVRRRHELWYGIETAERPLAQRPARWPRAPRRGRHRALRRADVAGVLERGGGSAGRAARVTIPRGSAGPPGSARPLSEGARCARNP